MDNTAFANLTVGNLITDAAGNKFLVLAAVQGPNNNGTIHIGVLPAFDVSDAPNLTLVDGSRLSTVIKGGELFIITQTLPAVVGG